MDFTIVWSWVMNFIDIPRESTRPRVRPVYGDSVATSRAVVGSSA